MSAIGQTLRWVSGGPDIPLELLQSAQEGNLVLFCGAGVSRRAGLPDFSELVRQLYHDLDPTRDLDNCKEFADKRLDGLLWTLERRVGTEQFRKGLVSRLTLQPDANVETHRALVQLATTPDGKCRLVTTNFDTAFEFARARIDVAPKLPIPKKDVWNSVVHLHGRIGDHDPSGRGLIVTSSDFGAAYLTEGWAAKFVTELFRRYSVLFVGYSVGDPVVRYMMDALAADRSSSESVGKAFVMVGSSPQRLEEVRRDWESRDMVPIIYDERDDHELLHATIREWSRVYQQGMLGRQALIEKWASHAPVKPYQSEMVSQIVWAVSQPQGGIAKKFAELDPSPSIEWLEVFDEHGLLRCDAPSGAVGNLGALCDGTPNRCRSLPLSPVAQALSEWLCKHLDDPGAVSWALRSGGALHPDLRRMVRKELMLKGSSIRSSLRKIWGLLADENHQPSQPGFLHQSLSTALSDGCWNSVAKAELLDALRPSLRLTPASLGILYERCDVDAVGRYADVELHMSGGHAIGWMLVDLRNSEEWDSILPELCDDVTTLLKRGLELFEAADEASPTEDPSLSAFPSIEDCPEHRFECHWTTLISLTRDSWRAMARTNPRDARRLLERWKTLKYPIFRRLTLLAMKDSDVCSPQECIDYLTNEDGARWLWSPWTQEESLQLISKRWPALEDSSAEKLASAILLGPPRHLFLKDADLDAIQRESELMMIERLEALQQSGRPITDEAGVRLRDLQARFPGETRRTIPSSSITVSWRPEVSQEENDWWNEWETSIKNLSNEENETPSKMGEFLNHWKSAVSGLARLTEIEQRRPWMVWRSALEQLASQNDEFLGNHSGTLISELQRAARLLPPELDKAVWLLWDRLFEQGKQEAVTPAVSSTANSSAYRSPLADLTDVLFARAGKRNLIVGNRLPQDLRDRLERLLSGKGNSFEAARVQIARRLYWLFAVDSNWTRVHLLPLFRWGESSEARGHWWGFLRNPQFTPELWELLKPDFLETLRHRTELGEEPAKAAAEVLAGICLQGKDLINFEEARRLLAEFDTDQLSRVAWWLWRQVDGAAEQRAEFWRNTAEPWFKSCWPRDLKKKDASIASMLAYTALASGDAFQEAVDTILPALVPIGEVWQFAHQVGSQPEVFPRSTLALLARVVDTSTRDAAERLSNLLNRLERADSSIENDHDFSRLRDYCLEHGY